MTFLASVSAAGLLALPAVSSPAEGNSPSVPSSNKSQPVQARRAPAGRKLTRRAEKFFLEPTSAMTEDEARSLLKKAAGLGDKLAKADLKALDRYDAMQANPLVQATENIWNHCMTNHLTFGHGGNASGVKSRCQDDMHLCGWQMITSDASIRSAAMLGLNLVDNLTIDDVQSLDACMAQQTQNDLTAGPQ
jgi:hypothetical protein